jgi:hypothetical protein
MLVMRALSNCAMERTDVIDLAAFRRNESQELSLVDLVEQAEGLIALQHAVLDECRAHPLRNEPDKRIDAVINSLQHLRRHMKLLRQLSPRR